MGGRAKMSFSSGLWFFVVFPCLCLSESATINPTSPGEYTQPRTWYDFLDHVSQNFNTSEFVPLEPIVGPSLKQRRIGLALQPEQCISFEKMPKYSTRTMNVFSVEAGDNLNITCMTIQPHSWNSTAPIFDDYQEIEHYLMNFTELLDIPNLQVHPDIDNSRFRFFSTLTLTNLTHLHVGEYSCSRNARLRENIFLFVRDHDYPASWPRTPSSNEVVEATLGSPTLIPCRPAHPAFNVTLYKDDIGLGDLYTFHALQGFIVPNVSHVSMTGEYECRFTSFHRFEQTRFVELKVKSPRNGLAKIRVDLDGDGRIDDLGNDSSAGFSRGSDALSQMARIMWSTAALQIAMDSATWLHT